MGCGIFCCFYKITMFRGQDNPDTDDRTKLERKLYLARESPDSIFDLTDCRLHNVPSGIYAICKVLRKEQLLLQNNLLKTIDDGGALSDLLLIKVLNLSCNHLHKLSPDIKYLTNLNELYLQDNNISHLPETIGHLDKLQLLDVSKNHLKLLPTSVKSLKNLRHLLLSNNPELKILPPELCYAQNLITLSIDDQSIIEPPADVVNKGLFEIMTYLCHKSGIEYVPASENNSDFIFKEPSPVLSPFNRVEQITWEQQEAEAILQESKLHEAAKQQRKGFLSHMIKEQSELDSEIAKVYSEKEKERQKLISYIQQEEAIISSHIDSLIKSGSLQPEMLKQQLEHERLEHDRLLAMCHENYNNNRKFDTLIAMETLLNEEYAIERSKKEYDSYIDTVKESLLMQELKITGKLDEIFRGKDEMNSHFVQQLLEDENIQKALVASLLDRVDARSWSLNQEISIVTSNLARLSTIEHEKQKLQIEYNYTQLLEQRVQLLTLLDELLVQQQKRRNQLMRTLQEMEDNAYEHGSNFWLANYQRLIDSTPHSLRQIGRNLDPQFANCLVEEGVIHCLPFLVKFLFSETALSDVSKDDLRDNGVSLSSDRDKILVAIAKYISTKNKLTHDTIVPSAPLLDSKVEEMGTTGVKELDLESQEITSECAICMDNQCEIVFVPCGHMCCCVQCAIKELVLCPMCRSNIEKRIKVIKI